MTFNRIFYFYHRISNQCFLLLSFERLKASVRGTNVADIMRAEFGCAALHAPHRETVRVERVEKVHFNARDVSHKW